MASIRKRGSSYQIIVSLGRDMSGRKLSESTTWTPDESRTAKQNEKALADFAYDFEKAVRSGKYLSGEKMTYAEFIGLWRSEYAEKQLEATTIERSDIAFKTILPAIGHIKLAALLPLHIQTLYSTLQKGGYSINGKHKTYSNNTIKRIHAVISGTLNIAVMWGLIDSNPCNRVKPPKVQKNPTNIRHFTVDEVKTFLGYLDKDYSVTYRGKARKDGNPPGECIEFHTVPTQLKTFYNLAIFGGFRRGELIALKWSDIDFLKCSVSVTKSTARVKGSQITKQPKTKSSCRVVSLPPSVMALLKRHKTEQQELRLMMGSAWQGEDWLFIQADGKQMDISTPNHAFKKIINRYNATTDGELLPVISIHGLRHTSATLAIASNMDVKSVSARLGHSETSTTLDIYAHALKEMDVKIANVLEDVLLTKKA